MKTILIVLAALALAGCNSGEVSLDSAIKHARDANFDTAITEYEFLVRESPENALYQNNLGWVMFRNGQFEEAREHIQQAAKLDLDKELAETIEINLRMIEAYDSSRHHICIDLDAGNSVAKLKDKETLDIQFLYSAVEIGYLLTAECYRHHGDAENAGRAYERLVDLYKEKEFESTLASKASAMLDNG